MYHPTGYSVFVMPASKARIDTNEKPWPIFNLDGADITRVEQFGLDRIFQVFVYKEKQELSIVVEALGPNGNIWLFDGDGMKLATIRDRNCQGCQRGQRDQQ